MAVEVIDIVTLNVYNVAVYSVFMYIRLQFCTYVIGYATECGGAVNWFYPSQHLTHKTIII